MKRIAIAFCFLPSLAFAQQAPQLDPQEVIKAIYAKYQRADAEAIQSQAHIATLEKQVADLKKQLDDAKKASEPKK